MRLGSPGPNGFAIIGRTIADGAMMVSNDTREFERVTGFDFMFDTFQFDGQIPLKNIKKLS